MTANKTVICKSDCLLRKHFRWPKHAETSSLIAYWSWMSTSVRRDQLKVTEVSLTACQACHKSVINALPCSSVTHALLIVTQFFLTFFFQLLLLLRSHTTAPNDKRSKGFLVVMNPKRTATRLCRDFSTFQLVVLQHLYATFFAPNNKPQQG